jgi:hypothetical protein
MEEEKGTGWGTRLEKKMRGKRRRERKGYKKEDYKRDRVVTRRS